MPHGTNPSKPPYRRRLVHGIYQPSPTAPLVDKFGATQISKAIEAAELYGLHPIPIQWAISHELAGIREARGFLEIAGEPMSGTSCGIRPEDARRILKYHLSAPTGATPREWRTQLGKTLTSKENEYNALVAKTQYLFETWKTEYAPMRDQIWSWASGELKGREYPAENDVYYPGWDTDSEEEAERNSSPYMRDHSPQVLEALDRIATLWGLSFDLDLHVCAIMRRKILGIGRRLWLYRGPGPYVYESWSNTFSFYEFKPDIQSWDRLWDAYISTESKELKSQWFEREPGEWPVA